MIWGIAFDGDADRCLMVDETGEEIDGDQVIAACGLALKEAGELVGGAIVGTVMSNLGLHRFCKEHGIGLFCTSVGDRNVLEKMEECGYVIGGEQSGHTIFRRYATTGDGQLTALQFLDLLCRSGKKASELVGECKRYPQVLINVPVADKAKKEARPVGPCASKRRGGAGGKAGRKWSCSGAPLRDRGSHSRDGGGSDRACSAGDGGAFGKCNKKSWILTGNFCSKSLTNPELSAYNV